MHVDSPFRALRSRNYRLFFIGQGISLIGTWMTRLGHRLAGLSRHRFRVPARRGRFRRHRYSAAFFIPPLAGVWVDRWDRR